MRLVSFIVGPGDDATGWSWSLWVDGAVDQWGTEDTLADAAERSLAYAVDMIAGLASGLSPHEVHAAVLLRELDRQRAAQKIGGGL